MLGMVLGGVVGLGASIFGAHSAAKQQRAAIRANRLAAKYKFSAIDDSARLMMAAAEEESYNYINEILRAGGAKAQEIRNQIGESISAVTAKTADPVKNSESLASGNAKARLMTSLYILGNKALAGNKTDTTSMISKMIDTKDYRTNQLQNMRLKAYQEMKAILSNPGPSLGSPIPNYIMGALSGAQIGLNLYNQIYPDRQNVGGTYNAIKNITNNFKDNS